MRREFWPHVGWFIFIVLLLFIIALLCTGCGSVEEQVVRALTPTIEHLPEIIQAISEGSAYEGDMTIFIYINVEVSGPMAEPLSVQFVRVGGE